MKITVNNEEVVCSNELTITEEMLTTSSTILNNCYPKSWEQDHDYISRFYYPKDYSKCKISDPKFIPGVIGTTTEGTDITINYDEDKNWQLKQLKGNTFQQTYTGKNLFNINTPPTWIGGGTTYSINDNVLKVQGNWYVGFLINIQENTDYYLNALKNIIVSQTGTGNMAIYDKNKQYIKQLNNGGTFNSGSNNQIYLVFYSGNGNSGTVEFSNIQLEKGNQSTSYEPYVGGTPSPNPSYPQEIQSVTGRQVVDIEGKNLFDTNNYTISGDSNLSITRENDGTFIINGTNTNNTYINLQNIIYLNGTYTLIQLEDNPPSRIYINLYKSNDYTTANRIGLLNFNNKYANLTLNNNCLSQRFNIEPGTYNNYRIKLMLAKGTYNLSNIGDYEPYQGQQYEINLGKNLFNINDDYVTLSRATISKNNTTITVTSTQTNANNYAAFLFGKDEVLGKTFTVHCNMTGITGGIRFFYGNAQNNPTSSISGVYYPNDDKFTFTVANQFPSGSDRLLILFYSNFSSSDIGTSMSFENVQVEKGSVATTYSPYYEPIELNKIGEYQDYIDGDVDNWYINKNIGIIDSYNSETISTDYMSTTGQLTTGVKVIYVLAEPTRTKITNTELVGQLNALAQANLLNGYNNIIVNSVNLPASLKIYYNFIDERYEENLMFCGVVKNTGNMSLNPRDPHYASLQVLDFKTMLSEGDTLGFVINNKTVPQAIQMVVDAISTYGVVVGNIDILNSDEVIGAYSTVDKTAYDVLQYLAEISQSRWTTRLIDENTIAIDFYDPTLMPQADDIEYTKEYFENNGIVDIQYNYGTYDYRNKQIMTSDQVYGSIDYVETILADGYNRTFNTTTNIGYIKSIFVNGVSKTFATKDEKEIGIESDFYYKPGQMQIESNENEPIISSNTPIVITYTPLVKGRQIIYNNDEVERVSAQTNRNGIISRYENRNDTLSIDELNQIGQTYIKYKGSAEINLIVNTFNYDLFNVGQLVYFNAPLNELKKQYMVKQKEITMYTAKSQQNIFVKYTLTSSFNSEREVNYFDNQRNKAKGNISAGEYITRNVDIENTANIIFNNLTIEEVEEGNVLNSILNSPLNN